MSSSIQRLRSLAHLEADPTYTAHGWRPPRLVSLDGNDLHFSRDDLPGRVLYPRDGLLTHFVRLETASPAEIEAFAREWGRLRLCAHGLPYTHRCRFPGMRIPYSVYLPPRDADREPEPVPPDPRADPPPAWWPTSDLDELRMRTQHSWRDTEPIEGWRYLARWMAGVLEAAAVLETDAMPSTSTWERAGGALAPRIVELLQRQGVKVRGYLLSLVNSIVAVTAPEISFSWTGLAIGGGLAPALAMQLALAVAREDTDFLPCSEPGCTNPARHARPGAKPYCGFHLAHGVRRRDELRRHRKREREKSG